MTDALLGRIAAAAELGNAQIHVLEPGAARHLARDDERWLYPASMIKLPLAVAAGAAIEAGTLTWDASVTIDPANATLNDTPSPMVPGYRTDVRELVTFMLQRSDNVATNQLFDVLDRGRATRSVHGLGFRATFFRRKLSGAEPLIDDPHATGRNSFPAAECARLLSTLAAGALPQADTLRAILATSWWDVRLNRGLADGDAFAHKTGDTEEVSHDGGILTLAGGRTFVVVVYTELPSCDENDRRFGAFMRGLRPHLLDAAESTEAP